MNPPEDLVIELELRPHGGRWVARTKEGPDSVMTFAQASDGARIINHTEVPPQLEGRGIARALVERAVADARAEGFKIEPRCSYVVAAFSRNPGWSDVRA